VLTPAMDAQEQARLRRSADILRNACAASQG
jgi:hypothetical protein